MFLGLGRSLPPRVELPRGMPGARPPGPLLAPVDCVPERGQGGGAYVPTFPFFLCVVRGKYYHLRGYCPQPSQTDHDLG